VKIDTNGTPGPEGASSMVTGYQTLKVDNEYLYFDNDGAIDSASNLHMVQVDSERIEQGQEVVYYYTITYSKIELSTHAILIADKVIDSDRLDSSLTPEQLLILTVLIVVPVILVVQIMLHRRKKRKGNEDRKERK
jgi:hypothetical protein